MKLWQRFRAWLLRLVRIGAPPPSNELPRKVHYEVEPPKEPVPPFAATASAFRSFNEAMEASRERERKAQLVRSGIASPNEVRGKVQPPRPWPVRQAPKLDRTRPNVRISSPPLPGRRVDPTPTPTRRDDDDDTPIIAASIASVLASSESRAAPDPDPEPFRGGGGEYSGAGASGSWSDDSSSSSSSSDSSSDSSSSSSSSSE